MAEAQLDHPVPKLTDQEDAEGRVDGTLCYSANVRRFSIKSKGT
jgi:hypothetical protein